MIEIALETSFRRASVALRTSAGLDEALLEPEVAHASALVPMLQELLKNRDVAARDIGAVYVGLGPGSYTGLRVGIATALGLARGAGARLRGEASGEALLWRELQPGHEGVYLLDARQEELYFARYLRTDTGVEVLRAPCVLSAAEVRRELEGDAAPIFCDRGALEAAGLDEACTRRAHDSQVPHASALLELASTRLALHGDHELEVVQPLYLRKFKAKPRRR